MDYGVYEKVKEYIDRYDMIARGDVVVAGVSGERSRSVFVWCFAG